MQSEHLQIPLELLMQLLVTGDYLEKPLAEKCLSVLQKMQSSSSCQSVEDVFRTEKLLSTKELNGFLEIVQFLESRLMGIIFSRLAIYEHKLSEIDLQTVLITHKAIFSVKRKIVPFSDLLMSKDKITLAQVNNILSKYRNLADSEYNRLLEEAGTYLLENDRKAQKWRKQHLLGIVGVKYAPEKKKISTRLRRFLTPSRPEPTAEAEELPPSRLEVNDDVKAHAYIAADFVDYEIDGTEPFQMPEVPEHKNSSAKYIIGGICAAGLLLLLFFFSTSSEKKKLDLIKNLFMAKEYNRAEKHCRQFRSQYPESNFHERVTAYLQQILLTRADIAYRQERLPDAKQIVLEAISLKKQGEHAHEAKKLLAEIEKIAKSQNHHLEITQRRKKILRLLQDKKIKLAEKELDWLKKHSQQAKKSHWLVELVDKVESIKASNYCFSTVNKEMLSFPKLEEPTPPAKISLTRIALSGHSKTGKITKTRGNFYPIVAGYLYAVRAKDGIVQWIEYLGDGALFPPIFIAGKHKHFNMDLVDKILAVSHHNNALLLINSLNGEKIWELPLPGIIAVAPKLFKSKIYVGCLNHYCYRIDLETGNLEGGYLTPGIPQQSPIFDKRQNLMYICCRNRLYSYQLKNGHLQKHIPLSGQPAVSPVLIDSYLIAFTAQQEKLRMDFYSLAQHNKLIKTLHLFGKITTPAALAGGILAVATDTELGLFGINPANPQEALFPLHKPLALVEEGATFLRFSNLVRSLLLVQETLSVYNIKGFDSSQNVLEKQDYTIENHLSKATSYLPIQKCGSLFFWAQNAPEHHYYHGVCAQITKDKVSLVWQRQWAPAVITDMLKTPDNRLLVTTNDGSIHEVYLHKQALPVYYRLLVQRKIDGEMSPLWIPKNNLLVIRKDSPQPMMLDAITGWEQPWESSVAYKGRLGRATHHNGTIFIGTSNGVFAIASRNGQKRYLEYSEFRGKPFLGSPIYHKDSVYIGCDNGQMYQLEVAPGKPLPYLQKKWTFATNAPIRSKPLVVGNKMFFGSRDHFLYAIDLNKKALLWKFSTQGAIDSTPVFQNNILYFGSEDRRLYALESKTGKLIWKDRFFGKIRSSPLIHQGKLYLASMAGDLRIYNLESREKLVLQLGGPVLSTPVVLHDHIFLGSTDGFLYCLREGK